MTKFELAQTMVRLGAVARDGARRRRLVDARLRREACSTGRRTVASGRSRPRSCSRTTGVYAPPPAGAGVVAERRRRRRGADARVQDRAAVDRDGDPHRARRTCRLPGDRAREPATSDVPFPPLRLLRAASGPATAVECQPRRLRRRLRRLRPRRSRGRPPRAAGRCGGRDRRSGTRVVDDVRASG